MSSAFCIAGSFPADTSEAANTGIRISGGMPEPSNAVPSGVRKTSFGKPKVHPLGSRRPSTSANTPCVFSPIRVTCGVRPMSACVNVSPALTVLGPINSTTGPRKPGRVLGFTRRSLWLVDSRTTSRSSAPTRTNPVKTFARLLGSEVYMGRRDHIQLVRKNASGAANCVTLKYEGRVAAR